MAIAMNKPVFAGIDVGAAELVLVLRSGDQSLPAQTFANTAADHLRLVKKIAAHPGCIVCFESHRVSRRLQFLREWRHEEINSLFPRSP